MQVRKKIYVGFRLNTVSGQSVLIEMYSENFIPVGLYVEMYPPFPKLYMVNRQNINLVEN